MDLVKEIQTKFMEMTSEFSSLFKHIQELHTQFSENQKMKIRRSSHLEQISIKWTEYKGQIKQLEKKKEYLSKIVELRSDQLIKQKYRERLLILKIIKLEGIIQQFLVGSSKAIGKELVLPTGEKLEFNQETIVLETPVAVDTKSNVFTKALFFVSAKIYSIIHQFVHFNVDFESHKVFLEEMEGEMKKEWLEINTEDKCTIEFEHRKIKSTVDQFSQLQESIKSQLGSLKINPIHSEDFDNSENWEEMGKLLETVESKISQKTKIKNNYEKIIREERLMVDRVLKTAEPQGKLWELCSAHREKLLIEGITNEEQKFQELIYDYTKCFNDLIKKEDQDNQANPNYLKMIVFHQTNLISSLHSDILRIQVGIESKKKTIQDGLREIFSQLYNQIHDKETSYRHINRSERVDRYKNEKVADINMTHIAYGGQPHQSDHKRNKSYLPSSAQKGNSGNSILGDLSDIKTPPDFSKKQSSSDQKRGYFKKASRKLSIKVNKDEKKEILSSDILGSGDVVEKPKVQSPKVEFSEPNIPLSYESLEGLIKESIENKKESEIEEGMKKYMGLVEKTVQESKVIEEGLNKMLDFVRTAFTVDSKYFDTFKELGYTTDGGEYKFMYEIPFEINVIHPEEQHAEAESVIREQATYKELDISKSLISKAAEPQKQVAVNSTQTQRSIHVSDVATQTQDPRRIYTHIRPIEIQISSAYPKQSKLPTQPTVQTGIQKDKKQQHHQAFALNQKIRMSTQLLQKKQQIMDLKIYKDKYQQLQRLNESYTQLQIQHSKCNTQIEERKIECKAKQESLNDITEKYLILSNQKKFLESELKKQEQEKNQRILREQDYIRHVLASAPPTVNEQVSKELEEKIIALMNKIISLEKNLSESMDEMEVSTIKLTEDIENLKHFVCVRLNATMEDKSKNKDQEVLSEFINNNIFKQNQTDKD